MKRIVLISIAAIVVLCGCQEAQKAKKVEAVQKMPSDVVGIWKRAMMDGEGGSMWAMEITDDGRVSWALIEAAAAIIRPGQVTKTAMADGQFSTFDVAPACVEYDPNTRQLTVALEIRHSEIRFMSELIEGNARYVFSGPVTEDGKTWVATFSEEFDYGPRFPMDPNTIGVPRVFVKVDKTYLPH